MKVQMLDNPLLRFPHPLLGLSHLSVRRDSLVLPKQVQCTLAFIFHAFLRCLSFNRMSSLFMSLCTCTAVFRNPKVTALRLTRMPLVRHFYRGSLFICWVCWINCLMYSLALYGPGCPSYPLLVCTIGATLLVCTMVPNP